MDSSPPYPIGAGQRLLAAIVFTDVVSFSALMQTEEVATLGLLERDFDEMRKLSEKYSGAVLKTTGDGLLLYFTSAVNAVACAQKMQRNFAARARNESAGQTLTHRVGIHLGDVFVKDEDVMGDGVNIAARLQSQAEPGGICISQTVYDVVKNKLELEVVKLEPRELKNISEPVPMYRILLEPAKPRRPRARPAVSPLLRPAAPVPLISRTQKVVLFSALVAGLALVAVWLIQEYFRNQEDLAQSRAGAGRLGALLEKTAAPATGKPAGGGPAGSPASPSEPDFVEFLAKPPGPAEEAVARRRAGELIPELLKWVNGELARHTQDNPLLVAPLPGSTSRPTKVYTDSEQRLFFAQGGAMRPRPWADLKPEESAAIIVSLLLDSPVTPPREAAQGADAYAYVYGQPAMAEALHHGEK